MRDASASSKSEPEQRPARIGPQLVPFDNTADAILQFEKESPDSDDGDVLADDAVEPARIALFPTDAVVPPAEETESAPESVAATPLPGRNRRGLLIPLLAVVVVTQGALLAYWMMSGRGAAAAVAATGNVTITSEPSESPVAIDGAVRGKTPLTIALAAGSHAIVVGADVQARSQSINVTGGSNASVHMQLPAVVASPAVTTGTLQIATEPPGARVWVDGEARGTSPITISSLAAGNHEVTVRTGAADAIRRTVAVEGGVTASLVITMPGVGAFASGWLAISSAVPLQVMEKGELIGTTDTPRILLPAGAHELELVNTSLGYKVPRSVTIAGGQTASFTLVPPRGSLSVNASPWAEVWIDGQRAGETPIGNYSIPIGTHELLFRHPELGEQRKTVLVGAQGPVRVGIDMKKP